MKKKRKMKREICTRSKTWVKGEHEDDRESERDEKVRERRLERERERAVFFTFLIWRTGE